MMLLDAGPLGNSSPLFCDLYEKEDCSEYHLWNRRYFHFLWSCCFQIDTGTGQGTKKDKFLEKIQTAFDRPPSFLENYVAIF